MHFYSESEPELISYPPGLREGGGVLYQSHIRNLKTFFRKFLVSGYSGEM